MSMINKFMMIFSHKFIINMMININKQWFGLIYDKSVWFGFKFFHKQFGLTVRL